VSDIDYIYIESDKEAERAVEYLLQFERLGYDTETTGLDVIGGSAKLLLMQLGTEDSTYLFDARTVNPQILKPIIESRSILKILHNAKFDYQSTKKNTGLVLRNVFDTMLAYRLLTSGLIEDGKGGYIPAGFRDKNKKQFPYKSLNFLTQKFLGISLAKDVRETFANHSYSKKFTTAQLKYAANDIVVLHSLCDILSPRLLDEGLIDTALLEFSFVRVAAEMELNGVQINKGRWRGVIGEACRQADGFAKEMSQFLEPLCDQNSLFGEVVFNINSQEQLLDAFKKLGFEIENTDQKVVKKIEHPLAKLLLDYRAYNKLISTYGEAILKKINRETGRLHFTLHQLGADTGRLSSENPNIQNIPNDKNDPEAEVKISFRECFEAAPGNVILTADYSQAELRILAEVSQDAKFLEIFRCGQDLHIISSQQVFGYSDAELETFLAVKAQDTPQVKLEDLFSPQDISTYKAVSDYRSKIKALNFGIIYGLSAFSLAERFKISMEEAEGILDSYFRTYHGIKRWLDRNAHETVANRYAKTILGRKKYFHLADPSDEEMFRRSRGAVRRMGNNHVIQGTNADITKEALINLQEAYTDFPGAKVLFTVHDEIISECPEEISGKVAEIKASVMRDAFRRFIKTVPVGNNDEVSVTIANHWSK
jgi:DNA polymerase I